MLVGLAAVEGGAHAAAPELILALNKLTDHPELTAEEGQLLAAVFEHPELLTPEQLQAILNPEWLAKLGASADVIAQISAVDTASAMRILKEAFASKISHALAKTSQKYQASDDAVKLVSAEQDTTSGSGSSAPAAETAAAGDGGMSALAYVFGGLVGGGALAAIIASGDSGESNAAPVATTDAISTNEDTAVTFDVRTNDTDANSDTLTVTAINGTTISTTTPVAIAVAGVTVGSVALNSAGTLTFTPAANFNGTPSFAYTLSDGKGGTATGTVNLTVAAVNDAPVNTVPSAALAANEATAVAVGGLSVADVDGGALTTTLSLGTGQGLLAIGSVTGGATVTGSGTASVSLAGTAAQINASLAAVTYTGATGFFGNATLTMATSDGTATDTDTRTIAVTNVQSGAVADGYIAGATVFIDVNGNGVLDSGEPSTTTNASGDFALASNLVGPIVAVGGTNIDTGLANTLTLTAPVGSTVVNPLTTLVQSLVESGATIADANAQIVAGLGLPSGTDLANFDLLDQPANDPVALAAQKIAAQIVTFLTTASDASGASGNAVENTLFDKIAASIVANDGIDLTSSSTLTTLLTGVAGVPSGSIASIASESAATNDVISEADSIDDVSNVQEAAGSDSEVLAISASEFAAIVAAPDTFAAFGVTTLDIDGAGTSGALTISDADATALINAGIHFAAEDVITLGGASTHVATSLTDLAALGVDLVAVTPGHAPINIDVGGTGLAGLEGVSLPQFDIAQTDAALDVTLNVDSDGENETADVAVLIASLGAAGIDHLDIDGAGVVGSTEITDLEGTALIAAGIDFADADNITFFAAGNGGTHVATTLVDLQTLGVDLVDAGDNTALSIGVGVGGLAALSASGLPQFDIAQSDNALDVTLNLGDAGFAGVSNVAALAGALAASGVDHFDFGGSAIAANATISEPVALAVYDAGLDFARNDNITLAAAGTQMATSLVALQELGVDSVAAVANSTVLSLEVGDGGLAALSPTGLPQFDVAQSDAALDVTLIIDPMAGGEVADFAALLAALGNAGIDHFDFLGSGISASRDILESNALSLISAGIDFAANDDITLEASAGTHLATSLHDLQKLGFDSVDLPGSTHILTVDLGAGGIDGLSGLPQFDIAQTDGSVDITLAIGNSDLLLTQDLGTLLGVDLLSGLENSALYGNLIAALEGAGIDRIDVTATGTVDIADGLAAVLGELDGFTAEDADLVLDALASDDHLLSSLADMAALGIDQVDVTQQGTVDPVYIDLGASISTSQDLNTLLATLDSDSNADTPLVTGSTHIALVIDQTSAETIAATSGAIDKLAALGFSDIVVLDGIEGTLAGSSLPVALIGHEDPLYSHLTHS